MKLSTQKKYFTELKKTIYNKKLKNILFLDYQNNIEKFLNSIDLYCCFSKSEASPTAVWEALKFKKPIISTDVGDLRFLNKKFKFGKIIKERNPKLFCRKIIEITENKSLFNSFSKAAYKLSEKFCAKKIAREVDKIVQNSL